MVSKKILVRDDPIAGFAGVVQAGALLFTSGCDGHRDLRTGAIDPSLAGQATCQTDNSYGHVKRLLERAGVAPAAVARIDHFTSSQDWIAERQVKRAEYFGKPSPHGSTGVAARMAGLNMVTTAVVAAAPEAEHEVMVTGADYGISHISSLVHAGPLLFLSGIRGTLDPRTGAAIEEETVNSFAIQTRVCYEVIAAILDQGNKSSDAIVRFDRYVRDRNRACEEASIGHSVLGRVDAVSTSIPLPMGMHGEVEVTALALDDTSDKQVCARSPSGQPTVISGGGFVFVGSCDGAIDGDTGDPVIGLAGDIPGQIDNAFAILSQRLGAGGSDLPSVVRLECYLRDIYAGETFLERAANVFGDEPPAVIVAGADLGGIDEVRLNAIAV